MRHLDRCSAIIRISALSFLMVISFRSSAVELWADEEHDRLVSLDTALKSSAVASLAPDDPILYRERQSAVGLFRLRLGLNIKLGEQTSAAFAYEHRTRLASEASGLGGGAGVLPSFAKAPYRISQLDWELAGSDTFVYRHELDRALLALHPEWGEVTVGRQAIGLGRGVLFSAVDVFAPFSPTEVDREWRRGVDAVRVEYRTSATSSIELLSVFGETWDDSAVLGRIRGYMGDVDGELIFGKRAEDAMVAGIVSAAVGDAEVHVELAAYDTPDAQPDGGLFGSDHLVGKAVLGASYTFDVGNGLTLFGEYHYSGFGVKNVRDATRRLRNAAFQERLLRGDMQILGRQALGCQLTYPFSEAWGGSLLLLASPVDGSGLISPGLAWDFSESGSLRLSAFIPWGEEPRCGKFRSEYGATAMNLFLQLSTYF